MKKKMAMNTCGRMNEYNQEHGNKTTTTTTDDDDDDDRR
jgi:hypothetical protein